MEIVYIRVKTQSNYNRANGVQLKVKQFLGDIVSVEMPYNGFDKNGFWLVSNDKIVTIDFNLKEVVEIKSI